MLFKTLLFSFLLVPLFYVYICLQCIFGCLGNETMLVNQATKRKDDQKADNFELLLFEDIFFNSPFPSRNEILGPNKMLLVITTCNEISATLRVLSSIEKCNQENFDVLFIDDASDDDTVTRLRQLGYYVITKEKAQGLTDSWNMGYKYFMESNYEAVIFANNDILLPCGAIQGIKHSLAKYPFVVPLTSEIGSGHNPSQAINNACRISSSYIDLIHFDMNYQLIQNSLPYFCSHLPLLVAPPTPKFNGFFFSLRKPEISLLEFKKGILFDPANVIFGQEDNLLHQLKENGIQTAISTSSFVYHFKSTTVKKSGYKLGLMKEEFNKLEHYHSNDTNAKRKYFQSSMYKNEGTESLSSNSTLVVGFAISDEIALPYAGDIFTAKGLGQSLEQMFGWVVTYLPKREDMWYDLTGIDMLITMLDDYDLRQVKSAKLNLVRIAWARNWFERWGEQPWIGAYDIIFASSMKACQYLTSQQPFEACPYHRHRGGKNIICPNMTLPVEVLRIGTGMKDEDVELAPAYDYVLTMNYAGSMRDIMTFDPSSALPYRGALYGANWNHSSVPSAFQTIWKGFLPFNEMKNVYRNSRIVIDDANSVTKHWGSVNSRVFDALAIGKVVLTNGVVGSKETFNNAVPTYFNTKDLSNSIKFFLSDDVERKKVASSLKEAVLRSHTYDNRAYELLSHLKKNALFPQ